MDWLEQYSVGIKEIDDQHKRLVLYVNDIKHALKHEETKYSIVSRILPKIVKYTIEHFESEEKFMKEIGFPNLERQIDEHKKLVKDVKNILIKIKKGGTYSGLQLYNFLTSWLANHIMEEDKKIGEFYRSNKKFK